MPLQSNLPTATKAAAPPKGGGAVGAAGTLYNESSDAEQHGWRTFDHLLVSGSLLGDTLPYLDETQAEVVATRTMSRAFVHGRRPSSKAARIAGNAGRRAATSISALAFALGRSSSTSAYSWIRG